MLKYLTKRTWRCVVVPSSEVVVHVLGVPHTVRTYGRGSGTPLLLRNGVGASLNALSKIIKRLTGRTVITVESKYPIPLWMPPKSLLVAAAVGKAGFKEIDVAGISYGGAEAQQLAFNSIVAKWFVLPLALFGIKVPRVRRMVLISTSPGALPGNPVAMVALMAACAVPSLHERLAHLIHGDVDHIDPEVLEALKERAGVAHTLINVLSVAGWTSIPGLPLLWGIPTQVVHGKKDRLTPPGNVVFFERLIPDVRVEWWENGGHLMAMEDPSVIEHILQFLDVDLDFVPGTVEEEFEEMPLAA